MPRMVRQKHAKRTAPEGSDAVVGEPDEPGEVGVGAASLVNGSLRRFPWPANPHQRYGFESPYLAVVNARGPWACWRHDTANPPYIPLCLDLFAKGFWRAADNGQRVFAITVWAMAAREDDWGVVWGDPVRLVHEWGLDAASLVQRLDWMIAQGLACYLTHAEAAAVRSWRPVRKAERGGKEGGGSKRGKEDKGEASSRQDKQVQEQASQDKQAQEQARFQPASSARAPTDSSFPGSEGKAQEQARQDKQEQASCKSQGQAEGKQSTASTQQAPEPRRQAAKLPESDRGAGQGPGPRPGSGNRSAAAGRPPSVPSEGDAVRIGYALSAKQIAWQNPLAVDFARHIVSAITGRVCNEDLDAASDRLLMDLGPWVYFWVERVQNSLSAGQFTAFRERCVKDISRKKRCRGIKNLGGLSRDIIVPGVLTAMAGGRD